MSGKSWPNPSDVNRVLAKLRSDSTFKSHLLRDSNAALTGLGIEIPKGVTVKVHEDTAATLNFILPPLSTTVGELTDDMLESVAGGARPNAPEGELTNDMLENEARAARPDKG